MKKGKFYTLDDYTITREGQIINKHNNHILNPQPNDKGYLRVMIGKKRYFVHKLVAEKYVENPENKEQVNHKDGNKRNNAAINLEWVTNQENRNHALKNGLHLVGEKCPFSKLTEKEAKFILNDTKYSINELAERFNVSKSTVRDIKNKRSWKHLKRYAEL